MRLFVFGFLFILPSCSPSDGGGITASAAPKDWIFRDISGEDHQPLNINGRSVALIFVTHDCPIANFFQPEIRAITNEYRDSAVDFFLVHVDPDLDDSSAREHAMEYKVMAPIIRDPNHQLVDYTGVSITPEVAVYAPSGDLVYRGRINDRYADLGVRRPSATTRELRDALDSVLAGFDPAITRTQAVGCHIADLKKSEEH